ncbi:MAG: sigma-54 dependent transcriptional regulator [Geobacteraceae bacterium]|nr:sigma-54 dependent transcriptional regulator [Geobacteraceae bacterium]
MEPQTEILLIDDDVQNNKLLHTVLERAGYGVTSAHSGEDALHILAQNTYAVVITDLMLPGVDGLEILKHLQENSPHTNVILITGNASAETAVEAMKSGAYDYITKPLNIDKLKLIIAKSLEKQKLIRENKLLRQQLLNKHSFANIIGTSTAIQAVFTRMEKVVDTDSSILILGESGTGKELVARALHYNGPRKDKPFVAINCGAIPQDLLESELFGHMRGSFTGAIKTKPGRFEQANGGTIFLDEIGTMPVHLQLKLLRVLQEQVVEPVGGNHSIKLNIRIISATNTNLEDLIAKGAFREDLFYRLNVIPINLPPLRERKEDISILARHFLKKSSNQLKCGQLILAEEAFEILEEYPWPGNVRELENIIERTAALCDKDKIGIKDLPPHISGIKRQQPQIPATLTSDGLDMPTQIQQIEREWIRQALEHSTGVKSRAAALLNIKRTTLVEKMKRLGIEF